jgi:hypothetical protein
MMYSRGWNYSKPAMRIAYIGYVEAHLHHSETE